MNILTIFLTVYSIGKVISSICNYVNRLPRTSQKFLLVPIVIPLGAWSKVGGPRSQCSGEQIIWNSVGLVHHRCCSYAGRKAANN